MATAGVYKITCLATGHTYVGSSTDVDVRWNQHREKLKLGVHQNRLLQAAWSTHGEKEFSFEVIEKVDPWRLEEAESRLIKALSPELNLSTSTRRKAVKEQKVTTTCRLPVSVVGRLKSAAWVMQISQSEVIEDALIDYFIKNKVRTRYQLHVTDLAYILMRCEEGEPPAILETLPRNGEPPEVVAQSYFRQLHERVDVVLPSPRQGRESVALVKEKS